MTPDEKDILDGEYTLLLVEESGDGDDAADGDEDGDGSGDKTALALDVPEPERAMAANAAAAGGKDKSGKGKKGKGKGKPKTGVDVAINDDVLGLEENKEDKPEDEAEAAQTTISAYDADEITDPEGDAVDPLMMILGANERPWENEKLSVVERMMLDPGYQRDMEAVNRAKGEGDPDAKARMAKASVLTAGIAAAGLMAAKAAQAAQSEKQAEQRAQAQQKGPGVAGVSRGPNRAADQDKGEPQAAAARAKAAQASTAQPITQQARQNAEDVTMRRMGEGLAASVGLKGATAPDQANTLTAQAQQKNTNTGSNTAFQQAMDMMYTFLVGQSLMEVSPYRAAGWDEKRLEQKENSRDVTIAPAAPAPKTPDPELNMRHVPQLNLGPGGP